MKKSVNEKGLTFVESLVTLSMLIVVGALVFGVLVNSLHIFSAEDNSSDIRQKANIIESQLTTFYKINGNFNTDTVDDTLIVTSEKKDGTIESREFSVPDYSITVESVDGQASGNYTSKDIIISIVNKENPDDKFELESNISRLKDGE